MIERKISSIGGYFVKLPNGGRGLLKSKNNYQEGKLLSLQSKVFYELDKPQVFTDALKIKSKHFILKFGQTGFSFSKKLRKNFDRTKITHLLEEKVEIYKDIFILCRSSVACISFSELNEQFEKVLNRLQEIKNSLSENNIYFDGLARNISLENYGMQYSHVIEEKGIFDQIGVWDQLEKIREGRLYLSNGSYLICEQTSAFLSIDVNSGRDFKINKKDLNLNACNEIFRVIRVLGFGGKILIDFLPSSQELRKEIFKKIKLLFSEDVVRNKIWGWTKSGLFELERERTKVPLQLLMQDF